MNIFNKLKALSLTIFIYYKLSMLESNKLRNYIEFVCFKKATKVFSLVKINIYWIINNKAKELIFFQSKNFN